MAHAFSVSGSVAVVDDSGPLQLQIDPMTKGAPLVLDEPEAAALVVVPDDDEAAALDELDELDGVDELFELDPQPATAMTIATMSTDMAMRHFVGCFLFFFTSTPSFEFPSRRPG
jgi:hypothetical protein